MKRERSADFMEEPGGILRDPSHQGECPRCSLRSHDVSSSATAIAHSNDGSSRRPTRAIRLGGTKCKDWEPCTLFVATGGLNLNVCERTNAFGGPSLSICGMCQATHWLRRCRA